MYKSSIQPYDNPKLKGKQIGSIYYHSNGKSYDFDRVFCTGIDEEHFNAMMDYEIPKLRAYMKKNLQNKEPKGDVLMINKNY